LGDIEAMSKDNDDFEFPDRPVEPIPQVVVQAEDLKLGPAQVKPIGRSWAEQHGPQPPGPGLRSLDFLILAMFAGSIVLFIQACTWAAFS
jgi:hypothetical protein